MGRGGVLGRFAVVGVVNTLIDVVLFMLLHDRLGIVAANFVSTSAGMTFSFVVNGRYTFGSQRLTLRHAALFLATNGLTLWVVQPLLIHGLLALAGQWWTPGQEQVVLAVKVLAIGASFVLNFVAYRWVVWPEQAAHGPVAPEARRGDEPVSSGRRP